MKLLIITNKVDAADDLLGFFIGWIKEFAKHFERVFVVALEKGEYDLPNNVEVFSLGKEKGSPKLIQALRFFRLLFKYTPQCDGVFAHISPVFAIVAWPFAKLFHKKLIFWYLHRLASFKVRLAVRLSGVVVTASRESLQVKRGNIIEVGHGIDISLFKTERNWSKNFYNILSVGRISPIKDLETLIMAIKKFSESDRNIKVKIVGRPIMPDDNAYLLKLEKLILSLGLRGLVEFTGFIPYKNMPEIYKKADISINLAPRGGIDKAVLESMAAGALALTSNEAFKKYFGTYGDKLIFKHGDSPDLAYKVKNLLHLQSEEKQKISQFLTVSVEKYHLASNTISRISELFKSK